MLGEPQRERFHMRDRILPGRGIHGVLHRVGRQARGVVAIHVDGVERAFELHVDRQVDDLVRTVRPPHLHQADTRLAVAVPRQHRYVPRYVV